MAKVGELERLVEGLVNRGLVAPKFVGRQVGQALIDELSNLGRNVTTSQATRQAEQASKLSDFQRQILRSTPQVGVGAGGGSRGPAIDLTRPFVSSRVGGTGFFGGSLNVVVPTSTGFKTSNIRADNPLAQFALRNTQGAAPDVNKVTFGGDFKNLLDIQNALIGSTTDPSKVTGFFQGVS